MARQSDAKRRISDHAVAKKAPDTHDHPRRKTMGALPANFTPSKHQVNLGHAASYYFGDTPHKKKSKTPAKSPLLPAELDETADLADTSMLSAGTSSSDGSDLLNKSVLSDTTELTASNFVLQASSRQCLLELSRSQESSTVATEAENVAPSNEEEELLTANAEKTDKPSAESQNDGRDLAAAEAAAGIITPAKPSPSLRSRLGESPSSLKKLSSSLRKEKQQNKKEATHRAAARQSSGGGGVSFLLPPLSPAVKESEDVTVEIDTDKPLDDLLSTMKQNTEQPAETESVSSDVAQGACTSPTSTIASSSSQVRLPGTPNATSLSSRRQATPRPKNDGANMNIDVDESLASPTSTKAYEGSHFRVGSGSHKKLTPTKLSQSPQRVVNPEAVDSPARNTRSAKKNADNSPAKSPSVEKMVIDSNPKGNAGEKRGREEELAVVSLSLRPGNPGRLSEVTLSPSLSKLKRRRSSIAPANTLDDSESVHSTSTASTSDLNNLLDILGPTKETVERVPAGMPAFAHPSPATADISIPRSILTSSRRSIPGSHQFRKSVVFGSPEAAEYRIDSPSSSLTPMPRGTAKAMFSMPSAQGSQSSGSTASAMEDETVEMEAALMQNVAAAESRMGEFKQATKEAEDMDTSVDNKSALPPLAQPEEDVTVELEPDIDGLFTSAFGSPHNGSMLHSAEKKYSTDNMESSPAESVDMTDAQSIASVASSRSGKSENLQESSQKLYFEAPHDDDKTDGTFDTARGDQSLRTPAAQDDEEDNTIELEADLSSLLAASGSAGAMTREAPKPVTLTKKFPKMDSSIVPRTNRLSFGDALVGNHNTNMDTNTGDDEATDGSLTKELETNMESLIKATGGDAYTPSASRRRSSHRFSLTPGSRMSLSQDGNILSKGDIDMEVDATDEGDAEMVDSKDKHVESPEDDLLEMDSKKLMDAAGLPETPSALEILDTLANVNSNSENYRNPLVAEAIAEFVFAVCGEVEMKAESSSDGNSCFNAIAEENLAQLLEIQKALRSNDALIAATGKEELKRLAQAAQAFVEFEWNSWEVQVVDSLAKALDGVIGEFEETDERLISSVTLADDALEAVSLMEGRAVQKARRQSMSRRKMVSQALEAEIDELEKRIALEKASLQAVQVKQQAQIAGKAAISDYLALSEQVKPSTGLAESLQHRFLTLNGMHCWSPFVIDEANIVVGFVGASPKTCMRVCFSFAKSGEVICQASVDPSFSKQRRGKKLKLTPLISEFVVANIDRIVESVNMTKLARGSDIVGFLEQLEMLHGRLEITASELFGLQKRYGTLLEADPVGRKSDFLLSVDFKSLTDSTALRATFELNSSYPFSPLNVSLDDREGKVDVDSMKRQLVKNAKPGFGYLSRTCDTISAFLR